MEILVRNTCQLANLTISKQGVESVDNHATTGFSSEEVQSTVYEIYGDDGLLVGTVIVPANGTVVVANLRVGDYTVIERVDWSWRYGFDRAVAQRDAEAIVVASEASITFELTPDGEVVTFYNDRETPSYWLGGDNYAKNTFAAAAATNR